MMQETKLAARVDIMDAGILIIDDQEANVRLLEGILDGAGYSRLTTLCDSRRAISTFKEVQPDLVLLDLTMPHLDGFGVMELLKRLVPEGAYLPILVLTADITSQAKRKALSLGATDFLTKPFDHIEVLLRIKNLLDTRFLHLQLHSQNQLLDEKVQKRTAQLEQAQIEMLERLASAAEVRDDDTGQHIHRVGQLSSRVAFAVGLPDSQVELIRRAAPLHDVGKVGIPDGILLKPGKLTDEEFETMKTHTTIGARILSGGSSELVQMAEQIALTHHERWDGSGYPQGLAGEAIPITGRIVAIADTFDALTHERPYKRAWRLEDALAEIQRQYGRQFDPAIVAAFLTLQESADFPQA
jgi:putative two-component system response regulator